MNRTDATLALFLAAQFHGTDSGVRATAKRCVKLLPRSKREMIFKVVESKSPLALVTFMAQNLEL